MATRAGILEIEYRLDTSQATRESAKFVADQKSVAQKIGQSSGEMTKGFGGLTGAVGALRTALFAGGAAGLVGGGIAALDRFFDTAAKISGVTQGFETLTARVGTTSQSMLAGLRPATRGLIDDLELMRQANAAIILGLPITSQSMAELSRHAVTLGRSMGVDATQALESMITGLGRQSKLMLDNIGIMVDVENANKAYAASLGKTVEQLTDAETKQAFYNATLDAARTATVNLSDDTLRLSDYWQKAWTAIKNASSAVIGGVNDEGGNTITGLLNTLSLKLLIAKHGLQQLAGFASGPTGLGAASGVAGGFGAGGPPGAYATAPPKPPMPAAGGGGPGKPKPYAGSNPDYGPPLPYGYGVHRDYGPPLPPPEEMERTNSVFARTIELLDMATDSSESFGSAWARTILNVDQSSEVFSQSGERIQQWADLAQVAILTVAAVYSQALVAMVNGQRGAALTLKGLVGEVLKAVGQAAIAEGAIKVASAIYPPNPPLAASGLKMIGAGTAAILLGAALSGGGGGAYATGGGGAGAGGGGGGSLGGGYQGDFGAPQSRPQEIHVYVNGVIADETEFARSLMREIGKQASRSGVA